MSPRTGRRGGAPRRPATARRLLVPGAVLSVALLAGCADLSPQQTTVSYQPADGINLDLGGMVSVSNLLVVSAAKGKPGLLSGQLVNTGTSATTVTIAGGGSGARIVTKVPAGATVDLSGGSSGNRQLPSVNQVPGAMLAIQIGTPQSGPLNASVPVLPPTNYYATLTPTAAPSSTSSRSSTASPTSTASSTKSTSTKPTPTSSRRPTTKATTRKPTSSSSTTPGTKTSTKPTKKK